MELSDTTPAYGSRFKLTPTLSHLFTRTLFARAFLDTTASTTPQDQDEHEEEVMEFRLFASQDTPSTIILHNTEPVAAHVHRERPDLDESPGSERMKQLASVAIDASSILSLAKIPWVKKMKLL